MMILNVYYLAIKAAFFYGLVHSFVKYETLQKHWLFLGLLYAAGVMFLSWVWFVAPQPNADLGTWKMFWFKTAILGVVYFRLLARFDEGFLFWMLLMAGMAVVYY